MKKAAVAVARRILTVVYNLIRDGVRYREQGADYFDRMHPERITNRLKARLESLGFEVELKPKLTPETSYVVESRRVFYEGSSRKLQDEFPD